MNKIFFSAIALFCLLAVSGKAQNGEDLDEISLRIISTEHRGIKIVEDFHTTASQHFRDPKAPRFLLYDQKRDVAFGIGGFVRVLTAYDFNGSPENSFGFIPYSIPIPSNPLTKNNFKMDASKSTLFFKLLGNDSQIGQYQAYISGNFTGANYTFQLDDAYISLLGFTIGRTWSTFNDIAAIPPTVDFQGPNGAAEMRTTQIRYTHKLASTLTLGIAAELPQTTGTYIADETAKTTQRIPDIPAYIQYNWGKGGSSHLRLAGVLRNINYRNILKEKTETETGYGMQLSGKINIHPFITFYGQATYGKGIDQYINDLSGNGLSIVSNSDNPGVMRAQEALGWFSQLQFNISKSVFSTVGYSQAKIFPKEGYSSDNAYNYGQYLVGNVFYNLTGSFQIGLEYLWGNRVNMDHNKNSANSIQSVVQFNF